MAKLQWDLNGERLYETGDRNVALFVYNKTEIERTAGPLLTVVKTHYYNPVAWNGITAITESPSGADPTKLWANDEIYATVRGPEQFGGTIEAYTYPDEWNQCDGRTDVNGVVVHQQGRKSFALAYLTTVGNDTQMNDFAKKLHIVYGATANPSERSYTTINDSPEAITMSWEYQTMPIDAGEGFKKTAHIVVDYRRLCMKRSAKGGYEPYQAGIERWNELIGIIFGTDETDGYLPNPSDIVDILHIPTPYESAVPYVTRADHEGTVVPPIEDPLDPITVTGDTVTGSLINRYKSGVKHGFILYELNGQTPTYPDNNLLSSYYMLQLLVYYPGLVWVPEPELAISGGHYETLDGRRIKVMFRYNGTTDSTLNDIYHTHETVEMFLGYFSGNIYNHYPSYEGRYPFEIGDMATTVGVCPADATQLQIVTMYADNDEIIRTDDLVLDLTYRPYGYLD